MTVVWSEQALLDVAYIRSFIARDAPHFADLFVDRVHGGTVAIATVFHTARLLGPEHLGELG